MLSRSWATGVAVEVRAFTDPSEKCASPSAGRQQLSDFGLRNANSCRRS